MEAWSDRASVRLSEKGRRRRVSRGANIGLEAWSARGWNGDESARWTVASTARSSQ
jgi:hypothetical protein